MKKGTLFGCLLLVCPALFAGVAGRKGVSDDQLLAFTVSLIGVLLLIGFSREIVAAIRKVLAKMQR
jgi:hypothetical protein